MASGNYNKIAELIKGTYDFDAGGTTVKVMLLRNTYTFDKTHNFVADVSSHEINATSYARQTLANKTITEDDTNNRVVLDADDVNFGSIGGATNDTIRYAIVYQDTGSDATARLITCIDFGANTPTNGGPINLQFNSAGITYLQQ
jgi:hypothetical protein